jgi:hypothetical protein
VGERDCSASRNAGKVLTFPILSKTCYLQSNYVFASNPMHAYTQSVFLIHSPHASLCPISQSVCHPSPAIMLGIHLWNSLITPTPCMCLAVREKPVDNEAQDREDEDEDAPEKLVRGRAVGLKDFHCASPH